MGHDDARDPPLPPALIDSGSLIRLDGTLPFDDFDALLSFATVMVGNDSGPKHLASLRGTPVVTLFSARIGWSEWGQETSGVIVSRRVPCAGCTLRHDPDECGKDVACIRDIRVDEVLAAVRRYL
jgi:ADP-heptose:LPS heptosyltransferase